MHSRRNQGAKITSNSWGSKTAPPQPLIDEIRISQNAGHLFIAAAGRCMLIFYADVACPAMLANTYILNDSLSLRPKGQT